MKDHAVPLCDLLKDAGVAAPIRPELTSVMVAGLEYDSRRVAPGFLFFAFAGSRADGRLYARQALERGAVAVVSELPPPEDFAGPWILVTHARRALACAARAFYGAPDERLLLCGITGTNGKTTTAYLTDSILRSAGLKTGLVGTIEYRIAGESRPAPNTTPESLDLHRLFSELCAAGGTHVTLEVSSHALALGRVHQLRFHTAVFTNLTQDHLDFHETMEAYFEAKHRLFEGAGGPPPAWAVLNAGDEWVRRVKPAPQTQVLWFHSGGPADLRARDVKASFSGLEFTMDFRGRRLRLKSPLASLVNVDNILAAAGAAFSLGLSEEAVVKGVESLRAVPGRFERVDEGQPFLVVVDYAHTDAALTNVIEAARALKPRRVITVFGCGGDRDRKKRPKMGAAAASGSDLVVLTSDNPRSEDPVAIMNDALVGICRFDTPYIAEPDRETAIRKALSEAGAGDAVIIAGKGHETYQIFGDRTIHFDDREVARNVLRQMGYGKPQPGANG